MGVAERHESDRQLWEAARTLADLGVLTARWLEGNIHWLPLYSSDGPDPETTPLIEPLAEMNRLGLWTDQSQPGELGDGWAQRANVGGYADEATANALAAGLLDTDLLLIALPAALAEDSALQIPITREGAAECTWAGRVLAAVTVGAGPTTGGDGSAGLAAGVGPRGHRSGVGPQRRPVARGARRAARAPATGPVRAHAPRSRRAGGNCRFADA